MSVGATTVLAVAAGVCWVEVDGEVVACQDDTGATTVLTGSSAVVFAHLDGTATLREVGAALSAIFGAAPDTVTGDVVRFGRDLVLAGLARSIDTAPRA